jgi:hypothetical protein
MFNNFFRKSCHLWDNVEKYGRARQATDDNIIRRRTDAIYVRFMTKYNGYAIPEISYTQESYFTIYHVQKLSVLPVPTLYQTF